MLKRRSALLLLLVVQLVAIVPAHAQIDAELTDDRFEIFFHWFNVIFGTLSPWALVGIGILAGGVFLLIIVSLARRLLGGGSSDDDEDVEFVDPLNPDGLDYKRFIEADVGEGKTPISEALFDKYNERLEILRNIELTVPDKKREYVYGPNKEKRLKLQPWERDFLLGEGTKYAYEGVSKRGKYKGADYRQFKDEVKSGYEFYVASKGAQYIDPPAPTGRASKKKAGRETDIFTPMINGGGKRRRNDDIFIPGGMSGGRGRRSRSDNFNLFEPARSRGRRGRNDDFALFAPTQARGRGRGGSDSLMDILLGPTTRRRRR